MTRTLLLAGCGSIGSRRARLLASRPDVWLKPGEAGQLLLYDRRERVARALQNELVDARAAGVPVEPHVSEWADGLLEADTVLVCAPLPAHVDLALDALTNGKHLFLEKPFARRADLVGNFPALAAERGLRAMVACNWRFHPLVRALHAEESAGGAGLPRALGIGFGIYPRLGEKDGGGWLLDLGSHGLDLAQHLRGPIAAAPIAPYALPGGAGFQVRHANGLVSTLALWYADPAGPEGEVRIVVPGSDAPLQLAPPWDEMYAAELAHFFSEEPVCNDLGAALETLRWLDAVRLALATR